MVQSFCCDIEILYSCNCNMQINLFRNRALVLKLENCSQERLKPFFSDWSFFFGKIISYIWSSRKIINLFIIYNMTDCFVFSNTFTSPSILTLNMMQKMLLQYSNSHVWKIFSVNVTIKLIYILNFFFISYFFAVNNDSAGVKISLLS